MQDLTRCACGGNLRYINCGTVYRRSCDKCSDAGGFVATEDVPEELVLGLRDLRTVRKPIPPPYCSE